MKIEHAIPAISVLDRGFVRLVDSMGSDLSIVRAARVSYDAAWRAGEDEKSDEKLLRYLIKHRHTSPFEAVQLTFEVKAPIFVFRQWHRHRTWAYNELSARYKEVEEEFYVPDLDHVGHQSENNKQARNFEKRETQTDEQYKTIACNHIRSACSISFQIYRNLINAGVPREISRSVLPLATYSHMFATVSLHNLFHFISLRDDKKAQYEIQVYARAMRELAANVVPVTMKICNELH